MPAPKGHAPYAGCETGGRPKLWTDKRIEQEADALREWLKKSSNFWFEEFAVERGYCHQYLSEFATKNEKFNDVYKYAQSWQKSKMVRGGLLKKFNSNIVTLVLSNTEKWASKQQTEISGDSENPLSVFLKQSINQTKDLVDDSKDS